MLNKTTKLFGASLVLYCLFVHVKSVTFDIRNNGDAVWIGVQGNPGHAHLHNGGFALNRGESKTLQASDNWAGRFWSRTGCNSQNQHCLTGDCGNRLECNGAGGNPPATLVEITLKGWGGLDYYDLSLVDGYNTKASIEPVGGNGDGGQYSCKLANCASEINHRCPGELQVRDGNRVIGCRSACNAFNTDQYCCRGAFNSPQACKSSAWPQDYPAMFKRECPDAYSYAYDDNKSTFTCRASQYRITFG